MHVQIQNDIGEAASNVDGNCWASEHLELADCGDGDTRPCCCPPSRSSSTERPAVHAEGGIEPGVQTIARLRASPRSPARSKESTAIVSHRSANLG